MTGPTLADAMDAINERKRAAGATPDEPATIDARLILIGYELDPREIQHAMQLVHQTQKGIIDELILTGSAGLDEIAGQATVSFVEGLAVGLALAEQRADAARRRGPDDDDPAAQRDRLLLAELEQIRQLAGRLHSPAADAIDYTVDRAVALVGADRHG